MQTWEYFDFAGRWSEFYEVWTSDSVQQVLAPDMQEWIATEAPLDCSPWTPKADLWQWSRTDYHHTRTMDKAEAYMHQHHVLRKFGQALERAGTPAVDPEALQQRFYESGGYEEILGACEPEAGSLEAHILVMGARYLTCALVQTAKLLFPGFAVCVLIDEAETMEIVIVPDKKLMLHLSYYWFWKDGDSHLHPDALWKAMTSQACYGLRNQPSE